MILMFSRLLEVAKVQLSCFFCTAKAQVNAAFPWKRHFDDAMIDYISNT